MFADETAGNEASPIRKLEIVGNIEMTLEHIAYQLWKRPKCQLKAAFN